MSHLSQTAARGIVESLGDAVQPAAQPVARIKGAWIDGGYVIVTPAGGVDAKHVKAFILAAFAQPAPAAQAWCQRAIDRWVARIAVTPQEPTV
jgi:hypothetical protein